MSRPTFIAPGFGSIAPSSQKTIRRILGINFHVGSLNAAVEQALDGGLVIAPSGPGLAMDLVNSQAYRAAVQSADLALTDSGWMILLWRLYFHEWLPRHSGLKFIRAILARPELMEPGAVFWVMPSAEDELRNRTWLAAQGLPITPADTYLAPRYGAGDIADDVLVQQINQRRPKVVMLAIGGGVQERLGHTLQQRLDYRPAICCLGAAIAFLSGGQANIPPWADRLFLGWFLRLLSSPRTYFPRYWSALHLAPLLWTHRERLPPLKVKSGR